MKYIRILALFYAILAYFPGIAFAQDTPGVELNIVVVTPDQEPIAGAEARSYSLGTRAVADTAGVILIDVPLDTQIRVSAYGFKDRVVTATHGLNQVVLEPDIEVVQLLFREADRRDVLGGVSVVNMREVFEKNYISHPTDGLVSLASGWNGNSLWGRGTPLIVVDGIPREVGNLNAIEIDEITLLKGAAAVALYGPRAINGVLSITTKRGPVGEQQIDIRVNTGMHVPIRFPQYLGAAEYMTLFNEARRNDGLAPTFSQSVIDNTASGINPYRFPDVDFYSPDFIRDAFNRSDINAEIYGGDANARYYANVGFMNQSSLLNFGEGVNAGNSRFNIRGNVDMRLNPWLTANVDAAAILSSGRGVQTNYWEQAANIRPTMGASPFHPLIPISMIDQTIEANRILVETSRNIIDGKYLLGGTLLDRTNPFAEIYAGGENRSINRQFMFNTGLDMDLSGITEGLSFSSKIGLDYSTSYDQGYNHEYRIFEPTWVSDTTIISALQTHETRDTRSVEQYINNSWFRQLVYFSGQLDYKRTINDNHNLHAMVMANGFQYSESGVYQKVTSANLGGFLGYNFQRRYYIDFNGSMMHSPKLPPGNRGWFSPTVSVGWRVSNEGFMEGVDAIDDLMLTASAGYLYSDLDIEEHYMYSAIFRYRGVGWFDWAAAMGRDVTASLRGANPNMEPPRRDELSFGFRTSLFDRALEVEANYFSTKYSGGLVQATALFPSFLVTGWPEASFIPYVNYNEEKRFGYDFMARLNQQHGDFRWQLGVFGTFYDTEILERPDVYDYAYRYREGRPVDGIWGWQSAGFFADQADIDNSPRQTFGEVRPGDIKYVDQNGDGIIDIDDEVFLARGGWFGAPYTIGVNLTLQWRNLTLYAQGVGRMGAYGMKNRLTDWVFGERKYSDVVRGRWAFQTDAVTGDTLIDTRATAIYPRLTTQSGENNFRNSDFWLYSTDRFDISKVQLTYNFPQAMFGDSFIRGLDVYVSGSNLLVISPYREYLETNVGSAPQTRFFNIGLNASF